MFTLPTSRRAEFTNNKVGMEDGELTAATATTGPHQHYIHHILFLWQTAHSFSHVHTANFTQGRIHQQQGRHVNEELTAVAALW
jgi:hypothetical protein